MDIVLDRVGGSVKLKVAGGDGGTEVAEDVFDGWSEQLVGGVAGRLASGHRARSRGLMGWPEGLDDPLLEVHV